MKMFFSNRVIIITMTSKLLNPAENFQILMTDLVKYAT